MSDDQSQSGWTCTNCGTVNPTSADTCTNCGSDQRPIPKAIQIFMDTIEKQLGDGNFGVVAEVLIQSCFYPSGAPGVLYIAGVIVESIPPDQRQSLLEELYARSGWTVRPKRIVVIEPDGSERTIEPDQGITPSYGQMKECVGGPVELVRVLRQDLPGYTYTYMVVHETGLIDGLPRNQKATELYLANNRRRFPTSDNPHAEARKDQDQHYKERGFTIVDNPNLPAGYEDDPYIAGTVIWFDGWTCDEMLEAGF